MSLVSGSNSDFSSSIFFFSRRRLELLAVELFQLLHRILVDGVHHVQDLQALL